ncbi:xaa-Pro aminopeptidase ApepP-like [Pectinophora gossypiella]|uniref:xaa-Pro aminopeptidase ApepP-like n=1 Tax=Pectinophora gossypiella TaxID=13191 RepID=UPI00214E7303|nr:xaa-Pro aminopeptidase ApepP-like [Pectinophora gossypiella]
MAVRIALLCFWYASVAQAHIPMRYINWAEPDANTYAVGSSWSLSSRENSLQRLTALRTVMAAAGVDAYIIPTGDAHNSQYIAPTDARREWISGLSGSSGTALVTAERALVWTDARYWTQFYMQVNTDYWDLMRQGTDLSIPAWLAANMLPDSVVGVDPTTYTRASWTSLQVRRASSLKLSELKSQVSSRGAAALVLTALDDIAYTLNLRGSDIPYNPVFFSYLIIRSDLPSPSDVILFWGDGALSEDIAAHLQLEDTQLTVRPYEDVFDYLREMSGTVPAGNTIWLTDDGSHAIYLAAEGAGQTTILSTISPVALIKCIKNEVELEGFRRAHIKDGTAVVRFLHWIHQQVDAGNNITEVQVSDRLEELRAEEEYSMGPSFATIAGAGENGAVIHYKPDREGPQRVVTKEDMLLVDSGGQYLDGTTDMTRTRHMSTPSAAQKLAFTRVLKGQISLATAVFPRGIVGHTLETLARKALWDVGLNYGHGTGHGVGHFLNVHEGPSWILSGPVAADPGIVPGMIFSNEPGYYEVGEYGIRHEDLVEVIQLTRDSDHPLAAGLVGNFSGVGALGFTTISLAPHQTACMDVDLLTDFELSYINAYHARVLSTIGPILSNRGLTEELAWLENECAPLVRSAAASVAGSFGVLLMAILTKIY